MKHRLQLQNKAIQHELKKCDKYGKAIDVMFKKYHEIGHSHRSTLSELSSDKANNVIEKEVFDTLKTLETRNIMTRQRQLNEELKREQQRERFLQDQYQATKDRLQRLRREEEQALKSSSNN